MTKRSVDPLPWQSKARGWRVTLLALGVLTIAGFSLLRAQQALVKWDFYRSLLPISPGYLLISGLSWGIPGLILAWGLWWNKNWALVGTRLTVWVFSAFYWFDRTAMTAGNPGVNWLFVLMVNILLIFLVYWLSAQPKLE